MALSGLHVTCAFIGQSTSHRTVQALLRRPQWSQTMTAAGTTTMAAPGNTDGEPMFEVTPSADSYVAIGSAPDATQTASSATSNARIFCPASQTRNIVCQSGDKLAWVAA